ncbi:hypothetical protein DFH06DRAFT_403414 [Mycena polygramma]|nr:hypothetical protein DFH06DRAFT_403414 [Mycena polygramma]
MSLHLVPAATHIADIADATDQVPRPSRIPVLINAVWNVLVADTTLGGQLRRPFWLPYYDYKKADLEGSDEALRTTFLALRKRLRLRCQSEPDMTSEEHNIVFTQMNRDNGVLPSVCFTREHHDAMEQVRKSVTGCCSADNITEMRQLDFATAVAFLHELAHIMWRVRFPNGTLTPEKNAACVACEADMVNADGERLIEVALWGGVLHVERLAARDFPDVKRKNFYDFTDDANSSDKRYISVVRRYPADKYLTSAGAAAVCSKLFDSHINESEDWPVVVDAFADFACRPWDFLTLIQVAEADPPLPGRWRLCGGVQVCLHHLMCHLILVC